MIRPTDPIDDWTSVPAIARRQIKIALALTRAKHRQRVGQQDRNMELLWCCHILYYTLRRTHK